MNSEVIFTHPRLTLTHYPKGNYILETWNGYTSTELFNELLTIILNFLVEKKSHKLILDTREHKGLSPEGQRHAADRCSEHAKKHGQLWHATVVPKDIFSKFSVDSFSEKIDKTSPMVNRFFNNLEEAMAWMEQETL